MKLKEKLTTPSVEKFISSYESFYSVVFNSVYTRIGNHHDSEDICQEVFIRFYDNVDEIENPRRWLFGCLKIVVIEFYKRRYSKDIDINDFFDDMSMNYVNGFRDTRIIIREILDYIEEEEPEDISLFELVAVYNFSLAEAARHQGLSYKQAGYRFIRITRKIADALKERGVNSIEDLL